jgi:undecaprenyl-diphosphatase
MNIWEAIILGIVQGLTEFLPVSSSGHIELGKAILGVKNADNLLFSVVVHTATSLSTLVVFRNDIIRLLSGVFSKEMNDEKQYAAKIILSMIPVGIVGLFFEKEVESFFDGRIALVSVMLLITGLLLLFSHFYQNTEGKEVGYAEALGIGIVQAIAVLPGISRSGSTVSAALLMGVKRESATKFSFLMVIIPILGAVFLKFLKLLKNPPQDFSWEVMSCGFVAAFIVGIFACKLMTEAVKKGKLIYFALYCFAVGTVALVWIYV